MANLKEIRNRIGSVKSTMQITSAMKMVSAAKLKRATDAITQMRPYSEKLSELLSNLSSSMGTEGVYTAPREVSRVLYVGVSSNRGLCGGFNNNILKRIKSSTAELNDSVEIEVLGIGKKVREFGVKAYPKASEGLPENLDYIFDKPNFSSVSEVGDNLMKLYAQGAYDKIVLVYNSFKNAATQIVREEQFLPIIPAVSIVAKNSEADYIFEPNKKAIVEEIIPKSLKTQLYKAVLDSHASEHGARMTAMHKATDNAGDLLDSLKLTYNKARQAAITNEILEIVGGAEALNS